MRCVGNRLFDMDFDLSSFERLPPVKTKTKLASELKLYNVPELKPSICVPLKDNEKTSLGGTSDQDLTRLKETLDSIKISKFRLDGAGDCSLHNPVSVLRTETLFSVFDDLIARITTGCHEQGFLLGRIRTDIGKTIANFQKHYINTISHSSQTQLKLLSRIEKLQEQIEEEKEQLLKLDMLQRESSDILSEKVSESSVGMTQVRGRQMDLLEVAEQKKEKLKDLILRTVKPVKEDQEVDEEETQFEASP